MFYQLSHDTHVIYEFLAATRDLIVSNSFGEKDS